MVLGTMRALGRIRLPELLRSFCDRYPGIDVVMREATSERMLEMLAAGELDAAFIQLPDDPPAGIITELLHVEEFALIVGPDHRLAGREEVRLAELAGEDWIVFTRGTGIDGTLRSACAAAGFEPHAKFESSALQTVRALAGAGLGVAMLPRSFAEAEEGARIVRIAPPVPMRRVALAWPDRPLPAGTAFVGFVRATLARGAQGPPQ
jgi:DNA-binding transcriptional LysR family regulator